MSNIILAIGQRGEYYYEHPREQFRAHHSLPLPLQKLLSSGKVRQIHHLTLGPDSAFVVSYLDHHNTNRLKYSSNLPDALRSFLDEQKSSPESLSDLAVILGPYADSWYATAGKSARWLNLPTRLHEALQSRLDEKGRWKDAPRLVALGADDNFLLVTSTGDAVWQLDHYRSLDRRVTRIDAARKRNDGSSGFERFDQVWLNPYRYENFMLELESGAGLRADNMPEHAQTAYDGLSEAAGRRWQRMREKQRSELESRQAEASPAERSNRPARQATASFQASANGLMLNLTLDMAFSFFKGGRR